MTVTAPVSPAGRPRPVPASNSVRDALQRVQSGASDRTPWRHIPWLTKSAAPCITGAVPDVLTRGPVEAARHRRQLRYSIAMSLRERLAAGPDAEAAALRLERLRDAGLDLSVDAPAVELLADIVASGSYLPQLLLTDSSRFTRLCGDPWLVQEWKAGELQGEAVVVSAQTITAPQ